MASTFKRLAKGQLPNASAAQYTVPALTKGVITEILLHNTGAGANTVTLRVVSPAGAGAGSDNIWSESLAAGANWQRKFSTVLNAGDSLSAFATNANEVNMVVSGLEIT